MDLFTLYKYRAINDWSLNALLTRQMWFATPTDFNDMFEFSVPIYISMTHAQLVRHYRTRFYIEHVAPLLLDKMMAHGGSDSFPVAADFVSGFVSATDENRHLWCIAAVHMYADQGMSDEEIGAMLHLDDHSVLRNTLERELRATYRKNQDVGLGVGVLCLSGRYADPLMWGHYGDACQGMCVGITFDADKLPEEHPMLVVQYSEELPVLDPVQFFDRSYGNVWNMLTTFYATKHVAWAHEREVRVVASTGPGAYDLPGSITEVILGEKVRPADFQRVREALSVGNGTVNLYQMMRKPGTWQYERYRIETE